MHFIQYHEKRVLRLENSKTSPSWIDLIINKNVPDMTQSQYSRLTTILVFTIDGPIKENIKKLFMITNQQTGKNIEKPAIK